MKNQVFTSVLQIGIVVDDLDKYMKKFNDEYGIGPWGVHHFNKETCTQLTYRGREVDYSMKLALCDCHNVQWELIEPVDDNNIYKEFLDERGVGIHHLAMDIESNHNVIEKMEERNVSEIQTGNYHGIGYNYFDTTKDLGFITEIYTSWSDIPEPVRTYPPSK